jgi:hypothetical protein
MYASLIPQFVDVRAGHLAAQGFLLGGVQIVKLATDRARPVVV